MFIIWEQVTNERGAKEWKPVAAAATRSEGWRRLQALPAGGLRCLAPRGVQPDDWLRSIEESRDRAGIPANWVYVSGAWVPPSRP